MASLLRLALLCILIALTGACTHRSRVSLVPDPDGDVGYISVRNNTGGVAIASAYQMTTVSDAKNPPTAPKDVDREKLYIKFAGALSVQPTHPLHFLLYFRRDATPTPESLERLTNIVAGIRARKSAFISVIGRADTMGTSEYNIDVSLQRALLVKDLLVKSGVDPSTIWAKAEGEENPVVPTADEVWELRNRSVEVVVR